MATTYFTKTVAHADKMAPIYALLERALTARTISDFLGLGLYHMAPYYLQFFYARFGYQQMRNAIADLVDIVDSNFRQTAQMFEDAYDRLTARNIATAGRVRVDKINSIMREAEDLVRELDTTSRWAFLFEQSHVAEEFARQGWALPTGQMLP